MSAYSFRQIVKLCSDPIKLMNFLLSKGLVKRHRNCAKVNGRRRMILTKDTSKKTSIIFVVLNADQPSQSVKARSSKSQSSQSKTFCQSPSAGPLNCPLKVRRQ